MSSGGDIRLRPPDTAADDDSEGDKGKFGDPKKLYKQNRELVKHNAQLTKLIEILKHEKDSLAIDKNKLKSDLKSTEKEYKKVKSEVEKLRAKSNKHSNTNMGEGVDEMQERVRQLEAELSQRDEKLARFRRKISGRLNQFSESEIDITEEKTAEDKEEMKHDPSSKQDTSTAKLEEENTELRLKVTNLESDLNRLLKLMDDQQRDDFVSSTDRSTHDISLLSTLSEDGVNHGKQISSSPFSSPRNSPVVQHKNETSAEIASLQSCLKLAIEEKKTAEQQTTSLQAELERVKSELEEAKSAWQLEKDALQQQQLLKTQQEKKEKGSQTDIQETKPQHESVVPDTLTEEIKQPSGMSSPTKSSTSGSIEQQKTAVSDSLKSDTAEPSKNEVKERPSRRRGSLQKQQSKENFTAALAVFQSGGSGTSTQRERSTSETSQGSHSSRSSASPGRTPNTPRKLSTENRSQSVTVVGKPPIHPSSASSSVAHSRQSSMDDNVQKSPSKMSIGTKRMSRGIAERRNSFEEQSEDTSPKPTLVVQHNRTSSSPIMTRTLGSPLPDKESELREKMRALEIEQNMNEEKAKKEQERKKLELEAQEKKNREIEMKKKQEAEEKQRLEKEKEEREKARKEREKEREREQQRAKQAEEKRKCEEERERKRQEERERARKEREEEKEREHKRLAEEKKKHEEERQRKRQEELEKKRLEEEKRKQELQAQRELQKAKEIEREKKKKEEREEALKKQKEAEEKKKQHNEKLRLEEEKRAAEKVAQAATDPQPHKINKHQSPFGSIAMRRAAFEQNTNPSNSSTVVLQHNPSRSPAQRPKSMDISALLSNTSPNSSPSISPTPRSPQISSISIKTSKSPQVSPVLNQRKEIKEVAVNKTISKPNPPITANDRSNTVSIKTTSSSPPLRRSQTISSSPASLAVSTPDLSSAGTTNGTSNPLQEFGWSPGSQRRTVTSSPKSPLSDRRIAKSVSFSPNLSTAGRSILKVAPPVITSSQQQSSPNKMKFGAIQTRLSVPGSEDMKKAQSLQNIPEHAPAEIKTPAATYHAPVASHVTRRPRSERAKTTSLSRADTANLTNLISKLQVKGKVPVTNGVDRSQRAGFTQSGRPASMYGSITPTR